MEEDTKIIIIIFIVILGILLFLGTCLFTYYKSKELMVSNFQNTIADLSDEQKCLHICGFEFHNYFENYKFCLEKCDRISERLSEGCSK